MCNTMRLKNHRFISLRFAVFILIISLFIGSFIVHCSHESRGDHFSATSSPPKLCNCVTNSVKQRQ